MEPDDAGDHDVPHELVELHETLEWAAAVEQESGEPRPMP